MRKLARVKPINRNENEKGTSDRVRKANKDLLNYKISVRERDGKNSLVFHLIPSRTRKLCKLESRIGTVSALMPTNMGGIELASINNPALLFPAFFSEIDFFKIRYLASIMNNDDLDKLSYLIDIYRTETENGDGE